MSMPRLFIAIDIPETIRMEVTTEPGQLAEYIYNVHNVSSMNIRIQGIGKAAPEHVCDKEHVRQVCKAVSHCKGAGDLSMLTVLYLEQTT